MLTLQTRVLSPLRDPCSRKPRNFLGPPYLEAKILVDSLADIVGEVEAEIRGNTLTYVEANILVDSMAETEAKVEAENLGYTLDDVEVFLLAEAVA